MQDQADWGLANDKDIDELKRVWLETDTILLTVTIIVSLLHTVFEVLGF